jgi:hypothetical protein
LLDDVFNYGAFVAEKAFLTKARPVARDLLGDLPGLLFFLEEFLQKSGT